MKATRGIQSQEDGAQFVIAVFDDWDALQTILEDMAEYEPSRSGAVLHARMESPPPAVHSGLLKEIIELHFQRSTQCIHCTRGEVAEELAARLASGARSLADALHSWLSSDQAWQLQSHIEKGRLVLWLRLPTSEDFGPCVDAWCKRARTWSDFATSNPRRDREDPGGNSVARASPRHSCLATHTARSRHCDI
jgi:hypothetical protein